MKKDEAVDRKVNREIGVLAVQKNAAIDFAILSDIVMKLGQEMRELGDTKRKLTREFAENLGSGRAEKKRWIKRRRDYRQRNMMTFLLLEHK